MNYLQAKTTTSPLRYQAQRLQELILEIIRCCQDRMVFESERFGLPQAELKCLMLFKGERYLTVKGIAQKLDVAKSRVTKIMEGLIRKGLAERINDPRDGRVRLMSLTPEGQKRSEEIGAFLTETHQRVLSQMKLDERKTLLSSLELLRSCMEVVKSQLK